jgi:CSLREA domain-containing protein
MKHIFISKLFNQCTLVALLVALIVSAVQVTPVYAASILVNSNADTQANDGVCTLREAIIAANIDAHSGTLPGECAAGSSGVDAISFAGNYTITVDSHFPIVTTAMTIMGKGAANTIIQAAATPNTATWRVFQVFTTGNLTLDGVTVRNGRCNGSCTILGGAFPNGGGGIFNGGTLRVTNSVISGNIGEYGAGIDNEGTLTVINSTISENTGAFEGGGIRNFKGGTFTLTVINSTFLGNTASLGGGIFGDGSANIANSTFSGNTAFNWGGGISAENTFFVLNSTFFGNTAAFGGGGINNANEGGTVLVVLRNTIVANNSGGNCLGAIFNGGNNLDSGTSCGFDFINLSMSNTNPMLGPLANNGGPTQTMRLLARSPAIDTGDGDTCRVSPVSGVDQRGMSRPQGLFCDIGAYEYNGTFWDVPLNYWAWNYVERLYAAGITGGCATSPLQYCPEGTVTRAQMAIFLLRGRHGSSYNPPAVGSSTGFGDVPTTYWAAAWIKQLAAEGITGGCGGGNYCPEGVVTRAQIAVFLLRAKHGAGYTPPAVGGSTGFTDVPTTYWAAAWIKQLVAEGITSGCGAGTYCPENPVTRAQMAVFLVRTFNLP